jgi:hypothetical protein
MRHLAAMLNVREVGKDQFVHTKYSRELVNYPMRDASIYVYVRCAQVKALLNDLYTDSPIDSTSSGTSGQTLQSGSLSEAGNTRRTYMIQLRHLLGELRILRSLSTLRSIQTRERSSAR